jgi:acetylornithine/succinyldiaminopimelate/putrescine aminotransferase
VGAMLATDKISKAFVPGNHASTFGGNPLAMVAAEAVMKTILQENILDNCRKIGDYFLSQLKMLRQKYKIIREVRGKGLMIALQLDIEASDIVNECLKRGLLINSTGGKTLRFVPPLIVTARDVDHAIKVLGEVMEGK